MSKLRYVVAGLLSAAALAVVPATTAFAGVTPSPNYTPTYKPVPPPQPRQWLFDVQDSTIGGVTVNNVEGTGAIPMVNWLLSGPSSLRTFRLLGNSVTIRSAPLPFPSINLATCTVTFNQVTPFAIVAGTGIAAGARSQNGQLVLQDLVSYPYVQRGYKGQQFCPLRFVSVFTILAALRAGHPVPGLPTPTFQDLSIQGFANVTLRTAPKPYATPSVTQFITPSHT